MTGETVWRHDRADEDGMSLAVAGAGPDEVWFEDHVPGDPTLTLRFPFAALGHLMSTVGATGDGPATGRLGGVLVERAAGHQAGKREAWMTLCDMLARSGVPFEEHRPKGNAVRCATLHRPPHPLTGHVGEITIRFDARPADGLAGLVVTEQYRRADDMIGGFGFHLFGGYEVLDRLPVPRGSADDLCPGAGVVLGEREVAFVDALRRLLVGDGSGGYGPSPGEMRNTVERWVRDAGATVSTVSHDRHYTALRAALPDTDEELFLHLVVGVGPRSRVAFIERYRPVGGTPGVRTFRAETVPGAVDTLAAAVEVPDAAGLSAADRLFAWVKHLAATGVIGPHLPRGANAELIRARFPASVVPAPPVPAARRERTVEVRHVYRGSTGCHIDLTLTFRPEPPEGGITFTETWDYMHRSGDGSAEYHYSVATSYRNLRRLADFLATGAQAPPAPPGAPDRDLENLVATCLRTLVGQEEPEIKAHRNRVRDLFGDAGVAAKSDDSYWMSPD